MMELLQGVQGHSLYDQSTTGTEPTTFRFIGNYSLIKRCLSIFFLALYEVSDKFNTVTS